ncbi:MAG: DUF1326 domain-containing protein [Emcibacter sp.]|nr:DUF1326 domain-containing protein [Emcibacter sp.]
MSSLLWKIRSTHFGNCNCDYGCPCQFNALPTHGDCRAVSAFQIHQGYHGYVSLDGLVVVATYGWPGPVHEGDGQMQLIIDERADPAQRDALCSIMQGEGMEEGAMLILQIYRAMCTEFHPPLFRPIDLNIDYDARTASLKVEGVVETHVSPIKNATTGEEINAQIMLPDGLEFTVAEVAKGTTKGTGAVPLNFENSHAHLVRCDYSSAGIVR